MLGFYIEIYAEDDNHDHIDMSNVEYGQGRSSACMCPDGSMTFVEQSASEEKA